MQNFSQVATPALPKFTLIKGLTVGTAPNPQEPTAAAMFGLFRQGSAVKLGRQVRGPVTVKANGALAIGNHPKGSPKGKVCSITAEKGAKIIIDKAIKVVHAGAVKDINDGTVNTITLTHGNGETQKIVAPGGLNSISLVLKDLSKRSGIFA